MDKFTFLGAAHTSMIEGLYDKFLEDPNSVDHEWVNFFKGFDFAKTIYLETEIPQHFQKEFKVYEREGLVCKQSYCKGIIKKKIISNRSSFFCKTCQK